jgi:hypothetical protein
MEKIIKKLKEKIAIGLGKGNLTIYNILIMLAITLLGGFTGNRHIFMGLLVLCMLDCICFLSILKSKWFREWKQKNM